MCIRDRDGRVRLCLDARRINQIIIPDRESPEPIDEIFQKLSGVKHMTSLDLTAGYWQVPLAPESRKYIAFLFLMERIINLKDYHLDLILVLRVLLNV